MRGESPEAVSTLLLQQEGLRGLQVRGRGAAGKAVHGPQLRCQQYVSLKVDAH